MNLNRDSESQGINEPEINVVSLIDVVLLLVVFFMVSSTFRGRRSHQGAASQRELRARQFDDGRSHRGHRRRRRARIASNERSLINNSPQTLRSAVLRISGERRKIPITIRADGRATHQSVVTAMDVVGRLGFAQINIATLNEQGGR